MTPEALATSSVRFGWFCAWAHQAKYTITPTPTTGSSQPSDSRRRRTGVATGNAGAARGGGSVGGAASVAEPASGEVSGCDFDIKVKA